MFLRKALGKILNFLFNSGNKHPYLEEAGITSYPENHWGGVDSYKPIACLRNLRKSKREKRKSKVDPRDCWDLDQTFYLWLYEHLCQLLKDTNANLAWRKFKHNEKEYTEEEYIKYLQELCLKLATFNDCEGLISYEWHTEPDPDFKGYSIVKFDNSEEELAFNRKKTEENFKKEENLRKELCDVFYELLPYLWW